MKNSKSRKACEFFSHCFVKSRYSARRRSKKAGKMRPWFSKVPPWNVSLFICFPWWWITSGSPDRATGLFRLVGTQAWPSRIRTRWIVWVASSTRAGPVWKCCVIDGVVQGSSCVIVPGEKSASLCERDARLTDLAQVELLLMKVVFIADSWTGRLLSLSRATVSQSLQFKISCSKALKRLKQTNRYS